MCAYKSIKTSVISQAVPVDNMKKILYSDWLFEGDKMHLARLGLPALIPCKKKEGAH